MLVAFSGQDSLVRMVPADLALRDMQNVQFTLDKRGSIAAAVAVICLTCRCILAKAIAVEVQRA